MIWATPLLHILSVLTRLIVFLSVTKGLSTSGSDPPKTVVAQLIKKTLITAHHPASFDLIDKTNRKKRTPFLTSQENSVTHGSAVSVKSMSVNG